MEKESIKTYEQQNRLIHVLDETVNTLALAVLIILILLCVYTLGDHRAIIRTAESKEYALYKPDGFGSFDELCKLNEDVIGWIDVYGTNIDYPVVQGKEHRFYLNHDARKKYSLSGSIFLDYRNNGFKDFNSILYGHNMSPAAMFGAIKSFKQKDFFEEHRYGDIFYENKHHGIEFFAMLGADGYDFDLYSPGLVYELEKQNYIDRIMEQALFTRDIGVGTSDRIILLSTCSNVGTNERDILIGRVSDKTFKNPYAEEEKRADAQSLMKMLLSVPKWLWLLLLWMLLLIVYVIHRGKAGKSISGTRDDDTETSEGSKGDNGQ